MNEFNENNFNERGTYPQMPQMPPQPPKPAHEYVEPVNPQPPAQERTYQPQQTSYAQAEREPQPQPVPPQPNYQTNNYGGYYQPYRPNGPTPPPYGQPPQQPQPPHQPYGYYGAYGVQPPQQTKMSGGTKAIIVCILVILFACVSLLTVMIVSDKAEEKKPAGNSNSYSDKYAEFFDDFEGFSSGEDFTVPAQEKQNQESYPESDASDKINKNYKGLELEKKPKDKNNEKYDASYSFQQLQESVVGIVCYYKEDEGTENYQSQGTGIVITEDGYIVTNSHVIGNSRKAYLLKVIMSDKKEYKAGVVGYDNRSDLAVLKIDAKNLKVAPFGDSQYTEITEDIIAIGNPYGIEYQNSVTKGIVSALSRKVSANNNLEFLQIDAPVNPGNSGGPVCNMYGQVIGITTEKIGLDLYEGMGFAIPSTSIKKIVDDIMRYGYVRGRVKLGITGVAVSEATAGATGIQIANITQGGPMDGTSAQVDDIITAVDGEKLSSFAEIFDILEKHKEGDKVKISLFRPSNKSQLEIEIVLQMDKAEG